MIARTFRSGAPCAALLLVSVLAFGEEAPEALDRVVVSASRSDTTLDQMPLSTTVITAADIAASPAQTLDQVLRNVPGLLVPGQPAFTLDPTGANIKLRGMDKKVLVLVDGVPVLDPFYTTIQWFKVPLSTIARVEIVRGGGSALWGNLAVGGVINIVTKRPDGNEGDASLTYGSFGTAIGSASHDFTFGNGLSARVSADGFRSREYNVATPVSRDAFWPGRGDSQAKSSNLRLSLFYEPNDDWSAFLRVGYHEQNEDIGGYQYGSNLQRAADAQAGVVRRFGDAANLSATAWAQHVHFDKYNGAGCYDATTFACGAPIGGTGATLAQQAAATSQYASSYDLNTYRERGTSLVYSLDRKGFVENLELGADLRLISGEDAQQTFRTPTAALPAALRLQRINHGRGQQDFAGAFAQLRLRPIEPLAITLDARFDRFESEHGAADQTNFSNVAAPQPNAALVANVPDRTKTAFDPALSARYALGDEVALRGSVYKGFRAPGLNNLYRSFGSNAITVANPLLDPETLVGEELGIDWRRAGLHLGATVFRENVKHVVATTAVTSKAPIPDAVLAICGADYNGTPNTLCPGTVSINSNGQDQRSTGVELDAQWSPLKALDLGAYATYTRIVYTRTTTGDPTDLQLPLVPRVVVGVNATWRAGPWTLAGDVRYNGAMTLSNLTIAPVVRQDAYVVSDVSTQYAWNARVTFYASITNLFDAHYADSSANSLSNIAQAAPRAYNVGARLRF